MKFEIPVAAFEETRHGVLVVFQDFHFSSGESNLLLLRRNGEVVWRAEGDPRDPEKRLAYGEAGEFGDGRIYAWTQSDQALELDPGTGKVIQVLDGRYCANPSQDYEAFWDEYLKKSGHGG